MLYEKLFGNAMALNRYLRMQYLLPDVRGVVNARVLDIGCLDGHFTRYLTGRGNKVFAVDIKEQGIGQNLPAAIFSVARGDQLPYADKVFDYIFCSDVLEHVARYEDIVPEISRVLKPGKTCLISTVDGYWQSPVKIRSYFSRHLPLKWRNRLMGRFAFSDEELHRSFMGHVRYDLTPPQLTGVFAQNRLAAVKQCSYCYGAGSLLMEIFFSFNETIRYFIFPFLRALLITDRWFKTGKPWQYYLVFQKNPDNDSGHAEPAECSHG